jgi:hypothetical protein
MSQLQFVQRKWWIVLSQVSSWAGACGGTMSSVTGGSTARTSCWLKERFYVIACSKRR